MTNMDCLEFIILNMTNKNKPLIINLVVTYQSTLIPACLNRKSETVPPNPHKLAPIIANNIPFNLDCL